LVGEAKASCVWLEARVDEIRNIEKKGKTMLSFRMQYKTILQALAVFSFGGVTAA